jgi:phosphomevalonate kinase
MTRARAPGKLVLSGAYSVLWGAPAIVTAVDRYALADTFKNPVHVADEVVAAVALGLAPVPCFVDASALRAPTEDGGSRKLGLGSSAAILLATLVAWGGEPESLAARRALFDAALTAHRRAQGGGSGVDVAASTFGGTLSFALPGPEEEDSGPRIEPLALPHDTVISVFAASEPATTSAMVGRVRAYAASDPASFERVIGAAREGALETASASSTRALVAGLTAQLRALTELGDAAGAPIVPAALRELCARAASEGGFFGPSGAGGGDVAFHAGTAPPSAALVAAAAAVGLTPLPLAIGAPGAALLGDEGARA